MMAKPAPSQDLPNIGFIGVGFLFWFLGVPCLAGPTPTKTYIFLWNICFLKPGPMTLLLFYTNNMFLRPGPMKSFVFLCKRWFSEAWAYEIIFFSIQKMVF